MTFNKSALAASISLVTLALAGCGGASSQDSGSSTSSVKLSGLVVDPYLAQAKVYVDLNNDGVHQFSTEDFAYTDKDGYFSVSKAGVDYCASTVAEDKAHCLNTSQISSSAVLRIEGGYDVATGQKFTGSMEMSLDLSKGAQSLGAANPLQSLYTAATTLDTAGKNAILDFIGTADTGYTSTQAERDALVSALTRDFLAQNKTGGSGVDPAKFKRAMQVHKASAILALALEQKYASWMKANTKVNNKLMPTSAGKFVYAAIAEMLATTQTPTESNWQDVLINAESKLLASSGQTGTAYVKGSGDTPALANRVASLFTWLGSSTTITNATDVQALYENARVADIVVGQAKREIKAGGSLPATNPVIVNTIGTPTTPLFVNTTLFTPQLDIAKVLQQTTGVINPSAPENRLATGAELFTTTTSALAQQKLTLTGEDTKGKVKVVFYFVGKDATATTGEMRACVKAVANTGVSYDKDSIEAIAASGTYLSGRWSRLTDFTANVAITTPVQPEQALLIKRTAVSGANNFSFSLDSGGDAKSWTGTLSTTGDTAGATYGGDSLPTSDASCKNLTL